MSELFDRGGRLHHGQSPLIAAASAPIGANDADLGDRVLEWVENEAKTLLQEQPWWARYANTVTATVGLLVNLIWLVLALNLHLPGPVTWVFAIVFALAGIVGVSQTPNGLSPNLVQLIMTALTKARNAANY